MTTLMHWIIWCEPLNDDQYERMWPIIDAIALRLHESQEYHVACALHGWED